MTVCNDPQCKSKEVSAQRRTMQFLKHLNPLFNQRRTLDEAIATMIQEESIMKLLSDTTRIPGVRSALMVSNSSGSENKKCYNCGKARHLKKVFS